VDGRVTRFLEADAARLSPRVMPTLTSVWTSAARLRDDALPGVAGESEPVTPDTMLRIASMTKTITTVAALQLWERGHLHLEAPVDTYCPQFAVLQVLDGFDGDTPRLCPPATRATVKQLITHTAGLGYRFFNENLVRWEHVTGTANVLSGSERSSPLR